MRTNRKHKLTHAQMKRQRNCLWEFQQIYNFSAAGDKDHLIWFWDQKVEGESYDKNEPG